MWIRIRDGNKHPGPQHWTEKKANRANFIGEAYIFLEIKLFDQKEPPHEHSFFNKGI